MGEKHIKTLISINRFVTSRVVLVAALAGSLGASKPALATDVSIKPGDQVVRIAIPDAAKLAQLEAMDLDIWSHEYGVGPIEVHVSIAERQALTAAGFTFEVVQNDLTAAYQAEQGPAPHGPGFTSYMDLPTIVAFINGLAAARPDLCSVSSIGLSIQNREIWVLKISGPGGGTKPGVFYHGLQHAREWITGPAVLYLANYLVSNYDTDPCVRELVNQTEFYLAPCINPDGYSHTWQNENTRLWRKNRRQNANGSFGVDLNRNWAYGWGGGGSSGTQNSDTYRGTAPFSEPETSAVRDFIIAHPNIKAHMDYHSYSQLIMWPFGYECIGGPPEPDATIYAGLGGGMQSLVFGVHGVTYAAGPICETIYQASGGSVDYIYGTQNRYGMTIELRPLSGNPGFLLPASQIIPTCEENLPAIVHLSRWASTGVSIEPVNPMPETVPPGTGTTVRVAIRAVQQTPVANSGRIHYRLGASGQFAEATLQSAGGDEYDAVLPAIPCGASIQFYFSATGDAGYVAVLPCGAPSAVFTAVANGACMPLACATLPGDMNADASIDGLDIDLFARFMTQPPRYAICADMAVPYGILDGADISTLISRLFEN